ncbi:MAG: DUF2275 domain-containing protein [Candidatus Hodarchaeota archaeon]
MECTDIQEKLSAYMEGMISPEEKVLFDEHLKMCRKCNESLAELKKTLEYVRNLEEIEPPPWLTKKVMTSVRSEAEARRGILQRLFYPLHIKLPIEALATIVMAVVTIYVFKTIQPEVELAKAPPAKVTARTVLQEKKETPALDEAKPLPAEPAEQFMLAEEKEIPVGKHVKAPTAPAKVAKRDKVLPSAGVVKKGELKREALPYEQRARVSFERKDEAISLTINVKDIETAGKEIEEAFIQYGGEIIKKEYFVQRNIIVAELDSKKVEELLEKLKRVGEIKEEALALEPREGITEIKIEIVRKQ